MGSSINYSGSLADRSSAPQFERDLSALCHERGWRCWLVQEFLAKSPLPVDLRGVSVIPYRGSELVHFHVSPDGHFVDLLQYGRLCVGLQRNPRQAHEDPPRNAAEEELLRLSPTAYALRFDHLVGRLGVRTLEHGPDAHIAVCDLLDYVKQHYAPNLEVDDDSGYFRRRNREALEEAMADTSARIVEVVLAVRSAAEESYSTGRALTIDKVVRRVEAYTGLKCR